jgi:hypothetical protein
VLDQGISGGLTAPSASVHPGMIPNRKNIYTSQIALYIGLLFSVLAQLHHLVHVQCARPDFPFQVDARGYAS